VATLHDDVNSSEKKYKVNDDIY